MGCKPHACIVNVVAHTCETGLMTLRHMQVMTAMLL
jgi:hypothetical protein